MRGTHSGGVTLCGAYGKHTAKLAFRPSGRSQKRAARAVVVVQIATDGSQVFQITGAEDQNSADTVPGKLTESPGRSEELTPEETPVNTTVLTLRPRIKYSGFSSVYHEHGTARRDSQWPILPDDSKLHFLPGASASFSFRGECPSPRDTAGFLIADFARVSIVCLWADWSRFQRFQATIDSVSFGTFEGKELRGHI